MSKNIKLSINVRLTRHDKGPKCLCFLDYHASAKLICYMRIIIQVRGQWKRKYRNKTKQKAYLSKSRELAAAHDTVIDGPLYLYPRLQHSATSTSSLSVFL